MWPPFLLTSASTYNVPTPESADSVDRWYHTHLRCVRTAAAAISDHLDLSALRSATFFWQGAPRPSFSARGRWRWLPLGCSGRGQTTLRTATVAACRGIGKISERLEKKKISREYRGFSRVIVIAEPSRAAQPAVGWSRAGYERSRPSPSHERCPEEGQHQLLAQPR